MEFLIERGDDYTRIAVGGRLDNASAPQFEREVSAGLLPSDGPILFDFTGLDYISSSGLRVVLVLTRALDRSVRLSLCVPSAEVRGVFAVSGFDKVLPIRPTLAEAEALLQSG